MRGTMGMILQHFVSYPAGGPALGIVLLPCECENTFTPEALSP